MKEIRVEQERLEKVRCYSNAKDGCQDKSYAACVRQQTVDYSLLDGAPLCLIAGAIHTTVGSVSQTFNLFFYRINVNLRRIKADVCLFIDKAYPCVVHAFQLQQLCFYLLGAAITMHAPDRYGFLSASPSVFFSDFLASCESFELVLAFPAAELLPFLFYTFYDHPAEFAVSSHVCIACNSLRADRALWKTNFHVKL